MPEPVTLIVGGLALYAYLTRSASVPVVNPAAPASSTSGARPISGDASGTGPGAPMETFASAVASDIGAPLSVVIADSAAVAAVIEEADTSAPADLVAALDGQTALAMRAYASLNPDDFAAFLDRYADRIALRSDMMLEALTDPPEQGFELTPQMAVSLGTSSYKVLQALNGVSVGRSVDLFGVSASVARQLPGVNPDLVSGLQAAAMAYRAIKSFTDVMTVVNAYPGLSVLQLGGLSAGATVGYSFTGGLAGPLMAVGLVVDIGFTIIGNKPDLQKAIDVALDVASLAVLMIPGIGLLIAVVIQLVKFIIDLFGDDLFGGGMSKEQREILEAARYGENLNPLFAQLADAYTPRELFATIVRWGSGYCGGVQVVAMGVNLTLRAGDQLLVGGQPYTVPEDTLLGLGDNDRPGGCYYLKAPYYHGAFAAITNDEQAWALGVYAPVNGIVAGAQVGVSEGLQVQFEDPTQRLIAARATPMREFLVKHRLTLDQIDQIALEYRAQPHLNALAAAYGWPTWQEFFAWVVEEEWEAFNDTITHGTLSDFARVNGHPTMYAFRAAALHSRESRYTEAARARQRVVDLMTQGFQP